MNDAVTVACVGSGYFSDFHFEAWERNPRSLLIGAADLMLEKAEQSLAPRAYTQLEPMLEAMTPDVLDIITPPAEHLKAIETAAQFSLRAIICQKPFCQSVEEARSAIAIAKAANIPLIIHENFRFQPWFRCIKQAMNENLVGQALQFSFRLRTGDGQGANAYLERQPYFRTMPRLLVHETGVHYVDTFRYLFGPVNSVYADLKTINSAIKGEDAGFILFEHQNGLRSVFDGNRLLDHATDNPRLTFGEAMLEGTNGVITLDGNAQVNFRRFGETSFTTLLKAQDWPGFAGDSVYAFQDHVVSALLDGNELENTAADYLPVLNMVETIYRSASRGQKIEVSEWQR